MVKKVKVINLVVSILIAAFFMFMLATPALAIASPDTFTIHAVYAYHNLLEDNDQLYLIDCTIDYAANPAESATEAFIVRLLKWVDPFTTTELGSQSPYAYFDDGYDRGVVAIYFSADTVATLGMTWAATGYFVRLEGNPMLTWAGARPITSMNIISYSVAPDQSSDLANRILQLADLLEIEWAIDLIETSGTGSYLSDYGEAYFTGVLPLLPLMCPQAFSGGTTSPTWSDRTASRAAGDYLVTRNAGTIIDTDDAADSFGMSAGSFGIMIAFLIIMYSMIKVSKDLPIAGHITLIASLLMIAFIIIGWIPMVMGIIAAVAGCCITLYVFFLEKSAT